MSEHQNEEFRKTITKMRASLNLVGLGGAVFRDGKLSALATDGSVSLDNSAPISETALWCTGSIGKPMTATMIGRLVEQGLCSFETSLDEIFKPSEFDLHDDWKSVTLDQLLSHQSGAKANFPFKRLKEAFEFDTMEARQEHRLETVGKMLATNKALGKKGRFLYSNLGYTIAGVAVSLVAGKSYEELMQTEVFDPLQMTSVITGAPKGDNPWGHKSGWFSRKPVDPDFKYSENATIGAPAGRWSMSLADLVKFGYEHLRGERGDSSLLTSETWKKLHAPTPEDGDYAYGWVVSEIDGARVIWHNGCNTMWYAVLWLLPEQDTAIAFTTNQNMSWKIDRAISKEIKNFVSNTGRAE